MALKLTMSRNPKKPRFNPTDPDKVGRGHKFARPGKGKSTYFKDKSKYRRKNKKGKDKYENY